MLRKKLQGNFEHPYASEEEGGNYAVNGSASSDSYGNLSRSVSHCSQNSYENYGSYGGAGVYHGNALGPYASPYQTPVKSLSSSTSMTGLGNTPCISNKSGGGSRALGSILPSFQSSLTPVKRSNSSSILRKSSHKSSCCSRCLRFFCTCLVLCILIVVVFALFNPIPLSVLLFHHLPTKISTSTFFSTDIRKSWSRTELFETQKTVSKLKEELLLKQNAIQDLTSQLSYIRSNTDIESMRRRETILKSRLQELHDAIAHESRQRVIQRHGYDHIQVTMFLDVPWKIQDVSPISFTVEMHSLDYVPHSVLTFLEQVEHGLWDNTYFITNAPHILMSSTVQDVTTKPFNISHALAFEKVGLDHLLYQEYDEHYPHTAMTLGFSGRPAGPNFYINKIDNTLIHGPGGQSHHDIAEEADPCFATVVRGKDILIRIFALPVQQGNSYELFNPVKITRAMIHPRTMIDSEHVHETIEQPFMDEDLLHHQFNNNKI